jgi:transposase InsO family protein
MVYPVLIKEVRMNTEIALRKEAVRRSLEGESQASIGGSLGRSARWVRYWLARYNPDDPEGSLQNRSRAPRQPHRKWSEAVRRRALVSRQRRQAADTPGYEHALIGAEAIHYELAHLSAEPAPPTRTIHHWLHQAGLIEVRPQVAEHRGSKPYPQPPCRQVNDLHQLDLKGPLYLHDSNQKHYLLAVRDVCSKGVTLDVALNKKARTIAAFLVEAWQTRGLPQVLQMDNGLEFRGSNRYPRSFGLVVRLALDVGVEPLFIPAHEPWRNGVIEQFNGLAQRLLLARCRFDSTADLQAGVASLQAAINSTHRLAALDGRTPDEVLATAPLRRLDDAYDGLQRDLQLEKGWVSFIRLVRPSGRITLSADEKFDIDPALAWHYVLARVDIAHQQLDVYFQDQLIKSFDFAL